MTLTPPTRGLRAQHLGCVLREQAGLMRVQAAAVQSLAAGREGRPHCRAVLGFQGQPGQLPTSPPSASSFLLGAIQRGCLHAAGCDGALRGRRRNPQQATKAQSPLVARRATVAPPHRFTVVATKKVLKKVQVVLTKQVDNVGAAGALVEVPAGYFRNYLLPQGHAKPATGDILAQIAAENAKKEAAKAADKAEAQMLATALQVRAAYINLRNPVGVWCATTVVVCLV